MEKEVVIVEDLNKVKENEAFLRMNYLVQAALMMSKVSPILGQTLYKQCTEVAKRRVLRIAPEVKRFLCKKCSIQIDSNYFKIIKCNKKTFMRVTCNQCGFSKKIFLKKKQ